LSGKITKIVFTHNPDKKTYDGNEYEVAFGTTAACTDKVVTVGTSASSNVMTVEVDGEYTFFKITHMNTYTQYWNSVEIFFGGAAGEAPEASEPEVSVPETSEPESSEAPEVKLPADGSTLTVAEILALPVTGDTTEKYYVTVTISEVYNTTYGNMNVADGSTTDTLTVYGTYDANGNRYDALTIKPVAGATITFYSILSTYNGKTQLKNAEIVEFVNPVEPEGGETPSEPETSEPVETPEGATTASVVIETYATANGWENSKLYDTIKVNDDITVTVSGTPVGNWGANSGKYYTSGQNWRIYQNENPAVTITAAAGKTIASVKITYAIKNTGTLTLNGENIASETVVAVNASSITFSVGNTGTATNGQAQITAIEVIYA
jgi:hypothetical protein